MFYTLIRMPSAELMRKLEQSDDREIFLASAFTPAQFRKAVRYAMLYAAWKYKPESGKGEQKYLHFHAHQEVRRERYTYHRRTGVYFGLNFSFLFVILCMESVT